MDHNEKLAAPLVTISEVAPSMESLDVESPLDRNNLHIDRRFQRKESLISSEISLYVAEMKPQVPDGGWGWLVVLACFYINMIADGVGFTFGLMYKEFLEAFGASKSATSWIGSLFMAIPLITGPIASALVDKYGCKYTTIVGGIICTVGFVLSHFAKSIGVIYLTFGVIGGLGQALCFVTAVVSIAFWFEKHRTLALGLAASGTGFGTVIFSPMSTTLLFEYGWRGTLLIISGFFANMCVCGFLMRDPDWIIEEEEKKTKKESSISTSHKVPANVEDLRDTLKHGGDIQYLLEDINATAERSKTDRFKSAIDLPTFLKRNENVPLEVLKQVSQNKQLYNIILENYPNLLRGTSTSEKGLNVVNSDGVNSRVLVKVSMKVKKLEEELKENAEPKEHQELLKVEEAPKSRMPLFRSLSTKSAKNQPQQHHSYLRNIRFRRNSIGYRGALLNINKYKLKASSCPDIYRNSYTTLAFDEEEKWYDEFLEVIKDLTHLSLFTELHFLLLSISTIILFIWFVVPYFYLAEHMSKNGYTNHQASIVISVIGFSNIIGMVLLGWAGDRLNIAKTYAGPFFGLFFASCLSLTPSLLAQLVPLEDFTMAYGLFLLCQGIGNLIGPPLAGFIFDVTRSWEQSFYHSGFWIIISGLLIAVIPFTENRKIFGHGPTLVDKSSYEDANQADLLSRLNPAYDATLHPKIRLKQY
ncbi:hypothetical protein NQ317_010926 [Molorchus minor]|uniref:Uncharacterized protein n=1 Tax=Molorchus minor TaxID=1323400 RepID=A0ABQ9J302_9CUCU|nr:hypothetical protein NQ317_010926 [Molorchus minor]